MFIMILLGRQGQKSAEQQRAKTQSEMKYLALTMTQMGKGKVAYITEPMSF